MKHTIKSLELKVKELQEELGKANKINGQWYELSQKWKETFKKYVTIPKPIKCPHCGKKTVAGREGGFDWVLWECYSCGNCWDTTAVPKKS